MTALTDIYLEGGPLMASEQRQEAVRERLLEAVEGVTERRRVSAR